MQIYPTYNNIYNRFSIRFQRILFWGIFYTIIGGVLRKWVFFGGAISNILLFGQLILPLILAWQYSKLKRSTKNLYQTILVIYFVILCMMAFNPLNHTIFHGIVGIIIHLGFFCLLLAYLKIANRVNVEYLDNFLFIILVIETVLSAIQYNLPPDHIINRFSLKDSIGISIGDGIRVTGTFSYLGGLGALVTFYAFYVCSLINRNKSSWLIITSIILTLYCALMSGGRTPTIMTVVIMMLGFYENRTTVVKKYIGRFIGIAIIIGIASFFIDPFKSVENAFDNWKDRTTELAESGEQSNRIYRMFFSQFFYHGDQPLFGAGLGSNYQGVNAVFGVSDTLKKYGYMEEEGERIVFEGGYVLYFIRIVLFIFVLSALKIKKLSKMIIFIFLTGSLIVFQTYNTFFLAMGLIWINNNDNSIQEKSLIT